MKPLTLQEVVTAMEGTPDRPVPVGSVTRVSIDSRAVAPGDLFIAIKGLQFDGHDYVGPACAAGAMAAVVRNDYMGPKPRGGKDAVANPSAGLLIRVDDPVAALGRLARYYRRSVIGGSVKIVAVTGSNGKTTTKAMIGHVLASKWQGRAGIKSFNNEIGVPLTLLSTEPWDTFLVCEVGTNNPGEIAALARLVEPEIAVITNVAEVHLEGLGSLEGVAKEKLSLLNFLRPDGCAIINADPEVLRTMVLRERQYSAIKKVMFGEWPEAELRLSNVRSVSSDDGGAAASSGIEFTVNDRFKYRLNVPGRHNAHNALAVIGVARRFGMEDDEIAAALATFSLPPMRLQYERLGELTLINDGYNANPASMAAALGVLLEAKTSGRRVFVVGDMRELGAASEQLHRELADRIGQSPVNLVIAVGENAKLIAKNVKQVSAGRIETHAYATTEMARRRLLGFLHRDDTVLVKGSRALALERLVEAIEKWVRRPTAKSKSPAR